MTEPQAIAFEDDADEYVDQVTDDLLDGSGASEGQGQGQAQAQGLGPNQSSDQGDGQDSGDSSSPPNFWLGPINVGPVTSGKPVDDPVTSGGDSVDTGPKGIVDNPGNPK
jgi:hypothetical protein